jgi:hypothetical protein
MNGMTTMLTHCSLVDQLAIPSLLAKATVRHMLAAVLSVSSHIRQTQNTMYVQEVSHGTT